jgi:hypothetical protein
MVQRLFSQHQGSRYMDTKVEPPAHREQDVSAAQEGQGISTATEVQEMSIAASTTCLDNSCDTVTLKVVCLSTLLGLGFRVKILKMLLSRCFHARQAA